MKLRSVWLRFFDSDASAHELSERFRLISMHPDQSLWVARAEERAIDFLGFRIRHNIESPSQYGEVSIIVVDPKWRRRGVGELLLEQAERLARQHRCIGLWLVSGFGREEEAHSFYLNSGFRKTGVRFVKTF